MSHRTLRHFVLLAALLLLPAVRYSTAAESEITVTAPSQPIADEPRADGRAWQNAGDAEYLLNVPFNTFASENGFYTNQTDLRLVDIEIRWDGANELYSAVWAPVDGTIYTLIQQPYSGWEAFFTANNSRNGRYLDVEVAYFGGVKLYSAIFLEDGDYYNSALHTTNTDADLQNRLETYQNLGYQLIDFEAYTEPDGDVRYAGIWHYDPNQPVTVLYYHLESGDVTDLIAPRIGRVIDIERYASDLHGDTRWALLFALDSGGEQYQRRNDTAASIASYNNIFADSNTGIIDIESYVDNGNVRYAALWGDSYKSLHEVALIPAESAARPLSTTLNNLLSSFEANGLGTIGLYAKNVRTGQSLAYRANEPFYLASTAKLPIHIKFWREVQNGHLSLNTTLAYTSDANAPDPWYTGNRSDSSATQPALGVQDFGLSFTLQQYDSMMMDVSDNAATSILMDDPASGLTWDSYDVNAWLADIAGVGQGWGPVTSIQDVDRAIMWQGQQSSGRWGADSFFLAPPSGLEALFRWSSWDCDGDGITNGDFNHDADCWGELQAFFGVNSPSQLPTYDYYGGHNRYYRMGLNTATPRATALLLEELVEGRLLDAANTTNAIQSMTEPTPFAFYGTSTTFPSHITIWAKGGVKGNYNTVSGATAYVVTDAAIFDNGPDDIVIAVLTEDGFRPTTTTPGNNGVRDGWTDPIGDEVVRLLTADLVSCRNVGFFPTEVAPGEAWLASCTVDNAGGGSAFAFDVDFYASVNTTISTGDYYLGSLRIDGIAGSDAETKLLSINWPDIPPGQYYLGWRMDDANEVGEIDEGNNVGYAAGRISVTVPTAVTLQTVDVAQPQRTGSLIAALVIALACLFGILLRARLRQS